MLFYAMLMAMVSGPEPTKTIGILAFDDVLTSEVTAPAEVFGMAANREWFKDWQVRLIGASNAKTITTAEGVTLVVDILLEEAPDVDVLIVPGAYQLEKLYRNRQLMTYIQRHAEKGRWIASNCSGAFVLGRAGVLDGYRATTWHGGQGDLSQEYTKIKVVEDQPIVLDRKRLTSNGGVVSYGAAFVLLAKLTDKEKAEEIHQHLQTGRLRPWKELRKLMP